MEHVWTLEGILADTHSSEQFNPNSNTVRPVFYPPKIVSFHTPVSPLPPYNEPIMQSYNLVSRGEYKS